MNERGQTKCEISVIISQCFLSPGCSIFFPSSQTRVSWRDRTLLCQQVWMWVRLMVLIFCDRLATRHRHIQPSTSNPTYLYMCITQVAPGLCNFYVCTVCMFYFCVHCVSGRRCRHKVNSSRCLYLCFPLIHLSVSSEAQFEKPVLLCLCVCVRVCARLSLAVCTWMFVQQRCATPWLSVLNNWWLHRSLSPSLLLRQAPALFLCTRIFLTFTPPQK